MRIRTFRHWLSSHAGYRDVYQIFGEVSTKLRAYPHFIQADVFHSVLKKCFSNAQSGKKSVRDAFRVFSASDIKDRDAAHRLDSLRSTIDMKEVTPLVKKIRRGYIYDRIDYMF